MNLGLPYNVFEACLNSSWITHNLISSFKDYWEEQLNNFVWVIWHTPLVTVCWVWCCIIWKPSKALKMFFKFRDRLGMDDNACLPFTKPWLCAMGTQKLPEVSDRRWNKEAQKLKISAIQKAWNQDGIYKTRLKKKKPQMDTHTHTWLKKQSSSTECNNAALLLWVFCTVMKKFKSERCIQSIYLYLCEGRRRTSCDSTRLSSPLASKQRI